MMIEIRRITCSDDSDLLPLIDLYETSFPEEERREISQLRHLIDTTSEMFMNAVVLEGKVVGLFVYWTFDSFHYIEHLAVLPELRNLKLGSQILSWASENLKGTRLLEVEPDDTEMAARRIGYYQRNNYQVLHKSYMQPSYRADEDACELWIMGSNETPQLLEFIDIIKEQVYRMPRSF